MIKKITKKVSSFSENILIKYYITRGKFKDFLSPIFDTENKERGLVISGTALIITGVVAAGLAVWGYYSVKSDIKSGTQGFFSDLLVGLGTLLISIASSLFQYASQFLSYVTSPSFNQQTITGNETFKLAWAQVRNIADMLIVLGFIVVGVATSLRIREYAAKQLLWKLIVVALFVNFSGLFCGLIIDTGNITMNGLLGGNKTSESVIGLSATINDYAASTLKGEEIDVAANTKKSAPGGPGATTSAINPAAYLGLCASVAIFEIIAAYSLALMALLLAARYAVLAVLFILSPLAFAFWIFPPTKKLWTKWSDNFIKWSFIGVGAAFFIYLAVTIMTAANGAVDFNVLFVAFIFLFIGYKMVSSVAPMVSSAIMGIAGGAAGLALGAAGGALKRGAKIADKMTGNRVSNVGRAISSSTGRMMERIGLRSEGTTAMKENSRVDTEAKGVTAEYNAAKARGDTGAMQRIQGRARRDRGFKGAAALMAVNEAGDLHEAFRNPDGTTNWSAAHTQLRRAESMGATDIGKKAREKNYQLAGEEVLARGGTAEEAHRASQNQLSENVHKGMSAGQWSRVEGRHLDPNLVSEMSTSDIRKARLAPGATQNQLSSFEPAIRAAAGAAGRAQDTQEANRLNKLADSLGRLIGGSLYGRTAPAGGRPAPTPPAPPPAGGRP